MKGLFDSRLEDSAFFSHAMLGAYPLKDDEFIGGSPTCGTATVDRLVDDATILRFTGKSGRDPREIVGAPLDNE